MLLLFTVFRNKNEAINLKGKTINKKYKRIIRTPWEGARVPLGGAYSGRRGGGGEGVATSPITHNTPLLWLQACLTTDVE